MDLRENLLRAARSYCEKAGIKLTTLSHRVRNDGKFFDGIASGSSCNIDTYEEIMTWFKQNPPTPNKRSRKP